MASLESTMKAGIWRAALAACVGIFGGASAGCSDEDGGAGGFSVGDDLVLEIEPSQVVFSAVNVGETATREVVIRNGGLEGTLRLRNFRLDTTSVDLAVDALSATDLAPGEQASFTITYAPADAVPDQGVVRFDTNVPDGAGGAVEGQIPVATLAQGANIRAAPGIVDFGAVEGGVQAERTLALLNAGQEPLEVTSIRLGATSSTDMTVIAIGALPLTLAPDASITVRLGYLPTGGGNDEGRLEVAYLIDGEARELSPPVKVIGREVGPRIEAFPNPIDFGYRPTGVTATIPLTLSNAGERPLVIAGVTALPGSSDTVELRGLAAGTTVAPGAFLSLEVAFTPRTDMVQTTGPIARLQLNSNDPGNGGLFDVLVFGRAEVPILQVNPPDLLDFGFVPLNVGRERDLVLFNAGNAPLEVSAITFGDDAGGAFTIVEDDAWGPTAATRGPGLIGPLTSRTVKVRFDNGGPAFGVAWGKVTVASNDGVRPAWEVNLKASRAGAPTCDIALVPQTMDFGIVARGSRRTMAFRLVNQGSGDCSFHSAFVNDCSAGLPGFFFQGSCSDPSTTIQVGGNSRYYRVTRTPPAFQNGLRAGQSYPLEVSFSPPDTAPLFGDEMTSYPGLVGVRVIDPYSGTTEPVIFPKPQAGTTTPWTPNLSARSGIAQLAVLPGEVEFGLTTIGCQSQTITVSAYNVGSADLDVTDIKLENCSVEFRLRQAPPLPLRLGANGATTVDVVYVPQDPGSDSCGLGFYTNGESFPTVVVPLSGAGTYETSHTDRYVQTTGQDVDVLFVVDNSGSMSSNQSNLAANFQSFIAAAGQWNNDYHIGVTTTDMDAQAGQLVAAAGQGRFVTRANTTQLSANFRVGTDGSADEKGLAAAQAALSLPLVADSRTACTTDTQCQAPERCVEGFCGGRNRGFLRDDAALEIVIVSDEEDSSPGDLNFYVNFFRSIKGIYNTGMMHLHAIVGDAPNGCDTPAGSAVAGRRYIDVATATGGSVISICDANFSNGLASIGAIAFGLRRQFYLARIPEPATIALTVGGQACADDGGANWFYDEDSNAVVFDEAGACMPQAGDAVVIDYDTRCFLQ